LLLQVFKALLEVPHCKAWRAASVPRPCAAEALKHKDKPLTSSGGPLFHSPLESIDTVVRPLHERQ
jgi:hypothetical protein